MKLNVTEKGVDLILQCLQIQDNGTEDDFITKLVYTIDGNEEEYVWAEIGGPIYYLAVPEDAEVGDKIVFDCESEVWSYKGEELETIIEPDGDLTEITDSLEEIQISKIGINFTKILYGNGGDATTSATELSNKQYEVEITSIQREEGNPYVTLEAEFNNSTVLSGFRATETGVLVADPDNPDNRDKDILFAYGYCEEKDSIYIPANSDFVLETTEQFVVYIGSTENVSAELSKSLTYASRAEFDEHVTNYSNPHAVTAEQVGLGNVENVSTNNQTPTYSVASVLATIISGEKMSVAFGKIKLAITSLINHLNNKTNPHEVTAEQVNAASKNHMHSASDINSGVLGVSRGGTGKSSFSQGQVLYASSSTAISGVSNNKGALYKSSSSSNPQFGTLPVSVGGTGVASLEGTDYSTSRCRGIAIQSSVPDSIPNGCIVGVYS